MTQRPVKRKYDAPSRRAAAQATRERICTAAEELFVRDGYARTSIRAVAKAARVSEATMYLAFANKAALLDAVILRATRDNPSESFAAIAAAPPEDILPRLAASNAVLMARAARLIALGESATLMDAELRPLRERAHRSLRAAFLTVAARLAEAGVLRPGTSEAADSLYAIATETTYLRMTEGAGLSPDAYARWLTRTLTALLLVSPASSRRRPAASGP
jgi:AcrR family transcriptional regulator